MKKELAIDIGLSICVCYTLLSVLNAIAGIINPSYNTSAFNSVMMFIWCIIGTLVLFSHRLLNRFSPLMMVIIQYLIACALILSTIFITGLFEPLHPDSIKDALRSFSIPFIIGAGIYYGSLYIEAKEQNKLIQEIRALNKE